MDRLHIWIHKHYSLFWSLYIAAMFCSLVCYAHLRSGIGWRQATNENWFAIPVLMIIAAVSWFDNGEHRETEPQIVKLGSWALITPVVLGLAFVATIMLLPFFAVVWHWMRL